ncbi:hypothetical protein J2S43_001108 [Catenuloplanes nepalensis]|uniref:Uncharacterized protein n=1 Tax=Catenuloplanes nepalensis TaxID=587533 RepID=A0ABT9MMD0_9ACTN|nr:hypothetical protein [Catenuloplanes nepalensis]MDP9792596.1 hypothetical protein [Catenuloplanes nepalensis]
MTASPARRVVVRVAVLVDEAAYQCAYGDLDDVAAFTAETIRAVAKRRMDLLGWGQVQDPGQSHPAATGPH